MTDTGNPKAPTEVKGSCSGGRLGGRSRAEDGRAAPKLVTGSLKAVAAEKPEAPTTFTGRCLGGRLHAAIGKGGKLSLLEVQGLELTRWVAPDDR